MDVSPTEQEMERTAGLTRRRRSPRGSTSWNSSPRKANRCRPAASPRASADPRTRSSGWCSSGRARLSRPRARVRSPAPDEPAVRARHPDAARAQPASRRCAGDGAAVRVMRPIRPPRRPQPRRDSRHRLLERRPRCELHAASRLPAPGARRHLRPDHHAFQPPGIRRRLIEEAMAVAGHSVDRQAIDRELDAIRSPGIASPRAMTSSASPTSLSDPGAGRIRHRQHRGALSQSPWLAGAPRGSPQPAGADVPGDRRGARLKDGRGKGSRGCHPCPPR